MLKLTQHSAAPKALCGGVKKQTKKNTPEGVLFCRFAEHKALRQVLRAPVLTEQEQQQELLQVQQELQRQE